MKNFFLISLLLLASFGSIPVYAVPPQDGLFSGVTAQGSEMTLKVSGGQITEIRFLLKPACMGLTWGLGFNFRVVTSLEGNILFYQYLRFDENNNFLGLSPGQHLPVYGFGQFDSPTRATGEIWHASAYFTGNEGEVASCLDTSNRFEVNYVGPLQ